MIKILGKKVFLLITIVLSVMVGTRFAHGMVPYHQNTISIEDIAYSLMNNDEKIINKKIIQITEEIANISCPNVSEEEYKAAIKEAQENLGRIVNDNTLTTPEKLSAYTNLLKSENNPYLINVRRYLYSSDERRKECLDDLSGKTLFEKLVPEALEFLVIYCFDPFVDQKYTYRAVSVFAHPDKQNSDGYLFKLIDGQYKSSKEYQSFLEKYAADINAIQELFAQIKTRNNTNQAGVDFQNTDEKNIIDFFNSPLRLIEKFSENFFQRKVLFPEERVALYTMMGHDTLALRTLNTQRTLLDDVTYGVIKHIIVPRIFAIQTQVVATTSDSLLDFGIKAVRDLGTRDQLIHVYKILNSLANSNLILRNFSIQLEDYLNESKTCIHQINLFSDSSWKENNNLQEPFTNASRMLNYLEDESVRSMFGLDAPESEIKKIPELREILDRYPVDANDLHSVDSAIQYKKDTQTTEAQFFKFLNELQSEVVKSAAGTFKETVQAEGIKIAGTLLSSAGGDAQLAAELDATLAESLAGALREDWLNLKERGAMRRQLDQLERKNIINVNENLFKKENPNDWISKLAPLLVR